jgi:hypothetical protein
LAHLAFLWKSGYKGLNAEVELGNFWANLASSKRRLFYLKKKTLATPGLELLSSYLQLTSPVY